MHSLRILIRRPKHFSFERFYCVNAPQSSQEIENTNSKINDTNKNSTTPANNDELRRYESFKSHVSTKILKDSLKKLKVEVIENEAENNLSITDSLLREKHLTQQKATGTSIADEDKQSIELTTTKKKGQVPESILKPSFNFAPFVNHSETLQELIKLGVDLSHWETIKDVPEMVLRMDFNRDFKPYIQFLVDKGVPVNILGYYFSKNPYILKESLENLQIRINYFESKNFSKDAISYMIQRAPFLLNQKTKTMDEKLGFYQKELKLTGDEIRSAIVRQPKLLTWDFLRIKQMHYTMEKEFGFSLKERKSLFLARPKLWLKSRSQLQEKFNYIHNIMAISHEEIVRFPQVLGSRLFRTKERHLYLESINRAQYDPTKENYVSLKELVAHNDEDFCINVARTTVTQFNKFLKTM